MAQEENLLKNSFRTDLACESRDVWLRTRGAALAGVSARQETRDGLGVETVEILDEGAAEKLCKPMGRYVTISLDALVRREEDAFRRACGVLAREIRTQLAMEPEESVLVVGLGNPDITPDAVGPLAAECVLVTRHLKTRLPEEFAAFRPVSVFRTGVLGTTGIESAALVRGVVSLVRPDRVIAVDALSAREAARLCRAVQVTDAGIVPGSGVGNARSALTEETLGVPVVAVGVPTVVDAATIVSDAMTEFISALSLSDLQKLDERERQELARELLSPQLNGLFVTPKNIDDSIKNLSFLISEGLNIALLGDKEE